MQAEQQEPMIIELDDPHPRWYPYMVMVGTIVVFALVISPFLLPSDEPGDTDAARSQPAQVQAAHEASSVCQPAVDFPSFAQPMASMVIPSWMRICDWFAAPAANPTNVPAPPVNLPADTR